MTASHTLQERQQALLGLLRAPAALETEGHGDKGDDQRARRAGGLGHDGGGPAARAAAHAGDQEDQFGVLDHGGDFLAVGLGRLGAERDIAAGAEAPGDRGADQHLFLHGRGGEGLAIGVDDGELEPVEILHLEAVDDIGAGAADAHHLDGDAAVGEAIVGEGQFAGEEVRLTWFKPSRGKVFEGNCGHPSGARGPRHRRRRGPRARNSTDRERC